MASLRKRPYTDPVTGAKKKTASYYGKYRNAHGKTVEIPLSPNRAAAQQMLADLVRSVEREKAGLIDHYTEHRSTPLANHLKAYRQHHAELGNTDEQAKLVEARVKGVFEGCGFMRLSDLSAEAATG